MVVGLIGQQTNLSINAMALIAEALGPSEAIKVPFLNLPLAIQRNKRFLQTWAAETVGISVNLRLPFTPGNLASNTLVFNGFHRILLDFGTICRSAVSPF